MIVYCVNELVRVGVCDFANRGLYGSWFRVGFGYVSLVDGDGGVRFCEFYLAIELG